MPYQDIKSDTQLDVYAHAAYEELSLLNFMKFYET